MSNSEEIVRVLTAVREPVRLATLVFLVFAVWRNYKVRREFVRKNPPVAYVPPPRGESGWRFGPLPSQISAGLERVDEPESSRLTLPEGRMGTQTGASIAGWILMMGGAWMLLIAMFDSGEASLGAGWRFGLPLILLLMGFGLTYVDAATRVVELTPTTATFIGRHGFLFYQRVVLKRRAKLTFAGSTQSAWTMNTHQRLPNYVLLVSGGFAAPGKRLLFMCTPAQGAWIRDALAFWAMGAAPGHE